MKSGEPESRRSLVLFRARVHPIRPAVRYEQLPALLDLFCRKNRDVSVLRARVKLAVALLFCGCHIDGNRTWVGTRCGTDVDHVPKVSRVLGEPREAVDADRARHVASVFSLPFEYFLQLRHRIVAELEQFFGGGHVCLAVALDVQHRVAGVHGHELSFLYGPRRKHARAVYGTRTRLDLVQIERVATQQYLRGTRNVLYRSGNGQHFKNLLDALQRIWTL